MVAAADLSTSHVVNLITYVGFAIGLLGLGFSIWQVRQALAQAEDFKEINQTTGETLERLGHVSDALSTRVLGEWPGYLSELARFVSDTTSYLKIVRDVPSYGIFSNLAGHQEYQAALEDSLARGNKLDIIFMSEPTRRQLNLDFASTPARQWIEPWPTLVAEWVARLSAYDPEASMPSSFVEYLDLLEHTNQRVLRRLENAASLGSDRAGRKLYTHRETDAMIPLYIWVRDGIEAIFAVAVLVPEAEQEIAFYTRDPGLVEALEAAFDRYSEVNGSCTGDLAPAWPAPASPATSPINTP